MENGQAIEAQIRISGKVQKASLREFGHRGSKQSVTTLLRVSKGTKFSGRIEDEERHARNGKVADVVRQALASMSMTDAQGGDEETPATELFYEKPASAKSGIASRLAEAAQKDATVQRRVSLALKPPLEQPMKMLRVLSQTTEDEEEHEADVDHSSESDREDGHAKPVEPNPSKKAMPISFRRRTIVVRADSDEMESQRKGVKEVAFENASPWSSRASTTDKVVAADRTPRSMAALRTLCISKRLISNHRDSVGVHAAGGVTARTRRHKQHFEVVQQTAQQARTRPEQSVDISMIKAMRRCRALHGCTEDFLLRLATGSERMLLQRGEIRDVRAHSPTAAVIIQSGRCRVEVDRVSVDELTPNGHTTFGLANVFAAVHGRSAEVDSFSVKGRHRGLAEVAVRGLSNESCRLFVVRVPLLKQALSEYPEDYMHLRVLLRMVSKSVSGGQQLLGALQCSEIAKTVLIQASTRRIFMPGEFIASEGQSMPDGMVLVRSGTIELKIGGVEVRRAFEGQVLGAEMLLGVCQKWACTLRCVAPCDVQILHRRVFLSLIREMHSDETGAEEQRESQRLLFLLEGRWREDKVILSWPLFRGYDAEFLATLARLTETRVAFPGSKICETGLGAQEGNEVALYFLLHGTCDESTASERSRPHTILVEKEGRRVRRALTAGATVGVREFLGLRESYPTTLMARTISLLSVLHRGVFLTTFDHWQRELQSAEVNRLLKDDLDQHEPLEPDRLEEELSRSASMSGYRATDVVIRELPLFKSCDPRFVDKLCRNASHRYCIAGLRLCYRHQLSQFMYILVRGRVHAEMDGFIIREFKRGDEFNTLALSHDSFAPTFTATCQETCELWALSRHEFKGVLESFGMEKKRFVLLLSDPLQLLTVAARKSADDEGDFDEQDDEIERSRVQLCNLKIFEESSLVFLQFVADHLESMLRLPDDVIVYEGAEDDSMYIICYGTVIVEGTETHNSQVSLGQGSAFGVQRFLEVTDTAAATATAVEACLLQVLHRNIFHHGLKLYPEETKAIENVAVSWCSDIPTHEQMAAVLWKIPLFDGCGEGLMHYIAPFVKTRLVRKGNLVSESGTAGTEWFTIIKSGVAVASGPSDKPRVHENDVINADVLLGLAGRPIVAYKAEKACVVYEVRLPVFMTALRRYPGEVVSICKSCLNVRELWPVDPEAVPLFHGVGHALFDRLMHASDWQLLQANQLVVKQGVPGSFMFMLCYGSAIAQRDGITVGSALHPGDCIGKANFFGCAKRYETSIRTTATCHFRVLAKEHLDEALALPDHAAEAEYFKTIRNKVAEELANRNKHESAQVAREKLRRRVDIAYTKHVNSKQSASDGIRFDVKKAKQEELMARRSSEKMVADTNSSAQFSPYELSPQSSVKGAEGGKASVRHTEVFSYGHAKTAAIEKLRGHHNRMAHANSCEHALELDTGSSGDEAITRGSSIRSSTRTSVSNQEIVDKLDDQETERVRKRSITVLKKRKSNLEAHRFSTQILLPPQRINEESAAVFDSDNSQRGFFSHEDNSSKKVRIRSTQNSSVEVADDEQEEVDGEDWKVRKKRHHKLWVLQAVPADNRLREQRQISGSSDSECMSSDSSGDERRPSKRKPKTPQTGAHQIEMAIHEYARVKREARLRGKAIRALKSGLGPESHDNEGRCYLSKADVEELDCLLPPLLDKSPPESAGMVPDVNSAFDNLTHTGRSRKLSICTEKILSRRFRQIVRTGPSHSARLAVTR